MIKVHRSQKPHIDDIERLIEKAIEDFVPPVRNNEESFAQLRSAYHSQRASALKQNISGWVF